METVKNNDSAAIKILEHEWATNPRWSEITRRYSAEEVINLKGTFNLNYTLATAGAKKLWTLLQNETYISALGALTGNQAIQQVQAGLKAIYASGWQVAGDANSSGGIYPDQSLYPVNSMPQLIHRINQALIRADQIQHLEGKNHIDWQAPIIADAEAGFGWVLNTFELIKSLIEAGAAAVHLEDQDASQKKCGHMGGKVLVGKRTFIDKLVAARLAADVLDVPTVLIARTDAESAHLLLSKPDEEDQPYLKGEMTSDGYHRIKNGVEHAIHRGKAYAPYADLLWWETAKPDIGEAREFAQEIHRHFPNKILGYNCSPSFNWKGCLNEKQIATFRDDLAQDGYKFQFITLAGFHTLNSSMYELAHAYHERGMAAYVELQEKEFKLERQTSYTAIKHQRFVGAGYFDTVQNTITQGNTSTTAMINSTEEDQFE